MKPSLPLHTGSLHSLQTDIEQLSRKLQHGMATSKQSMADTSWEHLLAQCDRLMRHRVTLRNSQPYCNSWAWMAEEPPGTTVGNLKKNVASLEASLAAVQR